MSSPTKPPSSPQSRSWHALHADQVVTAMRSDERHGLSSEEAAGRLSQLGPNALREAKRRPLLLVIAHQFKSPLIYLLLVAAGIALALGHTTDAGVIAIVLLLNAVIGAFQEGRAERSLLALRKLATHNARVVRDGKERIVPAREVVPGDLLLLEAGDAVAADARLLSAAALSLAEAALTGESVPVGKTPDVLASDTQLADRSNMVYAGTHVAAGRGRALIVATGLRSEIGEIATLAGQAQEPKTPLEQRIAQFGRYIMVAAAVLFVLVVSIGTLQGLPLGEILMIAVSQVVSMVPEGLPVAMTVALAVGVQRMARRGAVIRRLSAVETLGSTTVVCSDKTGTLTKNEMTVTTLLVPPQRELSVTGGGYTPEGELIEHERPIDAQADERVRELLEAITLCNDAQLEGPADEEPRWTPIGDPTEVALLSVARKAGIDPRELRARYPRRAELPFDSTAKMMATQHDLRDTCCIIIKGAPEAVLPLCSAARSSADGSTHDAHDEPLDEAARQALHAQAERLAGAALRVLAVAVVNDARLDPRAGFAALGENATLLGLLGEIDPPRSEVGAAVVRCRNAGIKPVMVTGDHKATGQAIARALGIARPGDRAVDGRELEAMSDEALAECIEDISVFARVRPAQKLRIIDAYQRRHDVVAMTGDGVNDAPALVKADVGVAMGVTGTDVAKEASKIVLSDDNFATIVAAVEEGRLVYRNLKKLILYVFATSMAEVVVLMSALLLGYPPPLQAVQILWINLVTDGALTVTLIMEPAEGDEMAERPIARAEPILTRTLLVRAAVMVPAMALSALSWFVYRTELGVPFAQVQTETFTMLAVSQWFNVLSCRSERRSVFATSLLRNRWLIGGLIVGHVLQALVIYFRPLGNLFHTAPLPLETLLSIAAGASLVLWVEEARKLIARRRQRTRPRPPIATELPSHA